MWPKEHGAYGQMAVPLAAALMAGGVRMPSLCLALAVVAAFVAHEPLLVLLGRRGARARREAFARAAGWLAVTATVAFAAGLAGMWTMPEKARWTLLVPMAPATLLAAAVAANREKGVLGEAAAALAFSCASVPVCLAGGGPTAGAFGIAAVFAGVFVAETLAVRAMLVASRGGGDVSAAKRTRAWAVMAAVIAVAGLSAAWQLDLLSGAAPLAAAPGLVVALWLAAAPPQPTRLRQVGWTLVATAIWAGVVLVVWR